MIQRTKTAIVVFVVLAAFVGVCWGVRYYTKQSVSSIALHAYKETTVSLDGVSLASQIADTQALQEQGLSGTPSLSEGHAMLFVFSTPGKYAFWMKDMNYAIDMIWLGADKKVVYVKDHATPDSYPQMFVSNDPAQYVIEVPDGFARSHGVKVGDQVVFGL